MFNTDRGQWQRVLLKATGWLGIALALPFLVWLFVGLIPGVPSLVDVFGIPGLRTPMSFAVAGLMLAAVGFWEN